MAVQSKRTAEHILRCLNNNTLPTNPKDGSPLDPAEIQLILFHSMMYDGFDRVPSEEEMEMKLKEIITGSQDPELITFARAWVDIRHFVDEDDNTSLIDSAAIFSNNKEDETNTENNRANKKRKCEPSVANSSPNVERACYQKLLENEPVGTFLLRPSSYQRKKQPDCLFDLFVITSKTADGSIKDNLIVKECGRGWTLTGARTERKTGAIVLDPIREYFPCFFDALSHYLSHFSMALKNVKRYSKQQLLEVYNDLTKTERAKQPKKKNSKSMKSVIVNFQKC